MTVAPSALQERILLTAQEHGHATLKGANMLRAAEALARRGLGRLDGPVYYRDAEPVVRAPGRPRKEGNPQIAASLRAAGDAARAAKAALAEAEGKRDDAIRRAVNAGWGQQSIADELGLTKARVGQIVKGV